MAADKHSALVCERGCKLCICWLLLLQNRDSWSSDRGGNRRIQNVVFAMASHSVAFFCSSDLCTVLVKVSFIPVKNYN